MRNFRYAAEKLKAAKALGYSSISEALIGEYRILKSARKVGVLLGLTSNGVRFALKDIGEPINGPGGYREGDIRKGRPKK